MTGVKSFITLGPGHEDGFVKLGSGWTWGQSKFNMMGKYILLLRCHDTTSWPFRIMTFSITTLHNDTLDNHTPS